MSYLIMIAQGEESCMMCHTQQNPYQRIKTESKHECYLDVISVLTSGLVLNETKPEVIQGINMNQTAILSLGETIFYILKNMYGESTRIDVYKICIGQSEPLIPITETQ